MFFRLCSRAPLTEIESAIFESLAGASLELIYEDIYIYIGLRGEGQVR